MSSLTNKEFLQGILYLKTRLYPLDKKLYKILCQIKTYHRNELFVKEQNLLDSVLNIQIFILPAQCDEELERMVENHEIVMMGFEDHPAKTVAELDAEIEEHERVMMGFQDYPAKTVSELDEEIEKHENFMMGFQDYPAKTVEELDREKREIFELMYQRILSDLNYFIQNFLNISSQDNVVLDDFEEKEFGYIKDNILVNLIKINLNIFDFLNRFELSNFFLFRKMILLQIKIVSYEEETIAVGKTQRGKIELILYKKKINQECLKQVMRKIGKFISNEKLEVQGPDGCSLF
jgi:hypothetical protein